MSGGLIAIHVHLEWVFMFSVLEKKFINMIRLFYNISSTVISNGTTCEYFPVYHGLRQGDPLSPYFFILSIEILGLPNIRQQTNIGGIKLENGDKILNIPICR